MPYLVVTQQVTHLSTTGACLDGFPCCEVKQPVSGFIHHRYILGSSSCQRWYNSCCCCCCFLSTTESGSGEILPNRQWGGGGGMGEAVWRKLSGLYPLHSGETADTFVCIPTTVCPVEITTEPSEGVCVKLYLPGLLLCFLLLWSLCLELTATAR